MENQTLEFLRELYTPLADQNATVSIFGKQHKRQTGKQFIIEMWEYIPALFLDQDIARLLHKMQNANNQRYAIHFMPSATIKIPSHKCETTGKKVTRVGRAQDVHYAVCLFADIDHTDDVDYPLPPSVILQTSKRGKHVYWFFRTPVVLEDDSDRETYTHYLTGLANHLRADKPDVAKKLKLPGFRNIKYIFAPMINIIEWHPEHRYDLSEFSIWRTIPRPVAKQRYHFRQKDKVTIPKIIQDALIAGIPDGQQNQLWFTYACWLKDLGYDYAQVLAMISGAPHHGDFSMKEIKVLVASAFKRPVQSSNNPFNDRGRILNF